jgi:cysteine-rich repeat protein
MRSQLIAFALCSAVALAACSADTVTFAANDDPRIEHRAVTGNQSGTSLAACSDPPNAGDPSCQPVCGDGKIDPGEQCDDGNTTNGDACENNCTLSRCGNGIKDAGEQCDDGPGSNGPGQRCNATCRLNMCGDGDIRLGVEQCDDGNATDGDACEASCTLPTCGNGIVDSGEQCDDGNTINGDGCNNSCALSVLAYLKASNSGSSDAFGTSFALSADGSTLAVGAIGEASTATGIGGNQNNHTAAGSGAVYAFTRSGTTWSQQAYIKASNTGSGIGSGDAFGVSVALSADGSTLAVGASGEDSAATGIGGDQADNAASNAGAVYVFTRNGTTWSQQAYVKASNTGANDQFGYSVALSADGTLAVVAINEDSAATGIGGNQANNSATDAGAVYVFQ